MITGVLRLDTYLAAARLGLSDELLAEVSAAADAALTPVPGEVYGLERDRDGRHGEIMRYNLQALRGQPALAELNERAAEVPPPPPPASPPYLLCVSPRISPDLPDRHALSMRPRC